MTTNAFLWGATSPYPEVLDQVLSLQDSGKRVEMGLEGQQTTPTSTKQQMVPGNISGHGQGPLQALSQEVHRESQIQQVHKQTFLSPQERFRGDEDYFRPISPEQLHSDCFLQDVNAERSQAPTSTRSLDNQLGSQRWLLASVSSQVFSPLPGLQVQEPELEVQSHALWPEPRTSGLHQADQIHGQQTGREHLVSPLPG